MDHFTDNQNKLIDMMIENDNQSIKEFHGDIGYDIFLKNKRITPEKEKIINKILKDAYDFNPNNKTNKYKKLVKEFYTLSAKQNPRITRSMTSKREKKNKFKKFKLSSINLEKGTYLTDSSSTIDTQIIPRARHTTALNFFSKRTAGYYNKKNKYKKSKKHKKHKKHKKK